MSGVSHKIVNVRDTNYVAFTRWFQTRCTCHILARDPHDMYLVICFDAAVCTFIRIPFGWIEYQYVTCDFDVELQCRHRMSLALLHLRLHHAGKKVQ